MSTHTPGPWRRALNSRGQWEVFAPSEAMICRLAKWTPPIDEADARVITAAPELLAACLEAYAWIADHGDHLPPSAIKLSQQLRAAIAKAEGREP